MIFDRIKEAGSLTDVELAKVVSKAGHVVSEDKLNKVLLDLEILGLVRVSWITKDQRRIEAFAEEKDEDDVDRQNKERMERDYEASFPGLGKD